MNKGLKKVLSYALITSMVASMALTNFGGRANASVVKAEGESQSTAYKEATDSAGTVNFSSILGRDVSYGILANQWTQSNHAETNFAVNKYVGGGHKLEPDLAGKAPLSFIVGDIAGTKSQGLSFGSGTYANKTGDTTYQTVFNIHTSTSIKENYNQSGDGYNRTDGTGYYIWQDGYDVNKTTQNPNLVIDDSTSVTDSITGMINDIKRESSNLAEKSTTIDITAYETEKKDTSYINLNHYYLDLDRADYDGKVVYVNVPYDSQLASFFKTDSSEKMDAIKINKKSSTVVVFNFNDPQFTNVTVKGPCVHVSDKDYSSVFGTAYNGGVTSQGSYVVPSNENSNTSNLTNGKVKYIEEEICEKIIWNMPYATSGSIYQAAGVFLYPLDNAEVKVKNTSSGWIATAGNFENDGSEWHFLYANRSNNLYFSGQKRFTKSYTKYSTVNGEKELQVADNVDFSAGDFEFELYSSNSSYGDLQFIEKQPIDAQGYFQFSEFTNLTVGKTYYYVIKENQSKTKEGITNSTGETDIKLDVYSDGGQTKYKITSYKYLTAEDKQTGTSEAYRTNTNVVAQENNFRFGAMFNLVQGKPLTIKKVVTGDDAAYAPSTDVFSIDLVGVCDNNAKLTGEYTATGIDGITSITFNNEGKASFTIKKGESLTISGLPVGATITATESNNGANYALQTQEDNLKATISDTVAKTITIDNKYTAPRGSIIFEKRFSFVPTDQAVADADIESTFSDLRFVLNDEDGNIVGSAFGLSDMDHNSGTYIWTKKIDDLPIGAKYSVQEVAGTNSTVGGTYKTSTSTVPEQDGVVVKESDFNTYLRTNTYTKLYDVTVQKFMEGDAVTLPDTFKITTSCASNSIFDGIELTKADATDTNPYTWTIKDVPYNTSIDFKETGAEVSGYDLKVYNAQSSVSGRSELNKDTTDNSYNTSATVGTLNVVQFANEYTRQKTNVTLKKKWVINNGGSIADSIRVQLYANNSQVDTDIVLGKDGSVSGGSGTLTITDEEKTWTYVVTGLNKYDDNGQLINYTWKEVIPQNATYELSIEGTPDANNVSTFTNTSPVQGKVTVNIKKVLSFTGNNFPTDKKYYVQIIDEDNKYYNASGSIVAEPNSNIEINTTSNTSVSLPTGHKYTIKEVNASQSNYTWTNKYTIGSTDVAPGSHCEIDVTDSRYNDTEYPDLITVTNTYVECGSLEITKVLDTQGDQTTSSDTFDINVNLNVTGTYTVNTYLASGGGASSQDVPFTAGENKVFPMHIGDTIEIIKLPAGTTYTVSETNVPTHYTNTAITNNGTGTIATGTKSEVQVTNKYTEPKGTLTITKDIAGDLDESSTEIVGKKYKFTVTGPNSYNQTVELPDSNGVWSATLSDLKLGTYTISETVDTSIDVDHYNLVVSDNGVVQKTLDINRLTDTATITNTYNYVTVQNSLDVTVDKLKSNGDYLSQATLQVQKLDGTVVTEWTTTGRQDTVSLGKGEYKLVEKTAPEGYLVASPITFKVVEEQDPNNPNNKILVLKDENDQPIQGLAMTDNNAPSQKVKISKIDIENKKEIEGAQLVLYKFNDNGTKTEIDHWTSSETIVYEFELYAGNYAIEETIAPTGYKRETSLVKFTLSFDANGNPKIDITEGPGEADGATGIKFENDPIKVTGKLSVHVEEKKTGRPVPDAEVEVTGPDGTTTTYKTNGNGEIVDVNGNTPIDVPAGKYKVTVKKVPAGYEVETGQTAEVEVPENKEGRHIAKIVSSTGGLKIKVLEEGTNREVPDATVVVEAPEGVKFPDGSTKITAVTDKNGNITTYTGADGKTYDLTSGLTPGDYKITVTKVPAGYQVTTGETKTKKVVKDEVAEHVALIATSSSVKPAPAPAPAPAATPAATPATPTGSITNSINVKTGDDMNVYPALIAMALSLITGVSVVAFRRKRETK